MVSPIIAETAAFFRVRLELWGVIPQNLLILADDCLIFLFFVLRFCVIPRIFAFDFFD